MYAKRYQAYIFWHMLRVSFYILLDLLPFIICIVSFTVRVVKYDLSGPQLMRFVVCLLLSTLFGIFCASAIIKDYCKEIAQLQSGRLMIESGTVMENTKNKYLIALSAPGGNKKGRSRTRPKLFRILRKNRECDFHVGDQVTVVYAATPILQMDGLSASKLTFGVQPAYAIYAFSGDKTKSIPPVKWKQA